MRPRSRLLFKRGLMLPTIREGTEETVRDFNEANTLHIGDHGQAVSSEDYLLSICHLACPTFPSRDASLENVHAQQQDAVQHRLRPSRLIGPTVRTLEINFKKEAQNTDVQQGEEKELNGESIYSSSDPLEYLYGHQNNLSTLSGSVRRAFVEGRFVRQHGSVWEIQSRPRTNSIPLASIPDITSRRKSSCPEIHTDTKTAIPNVSPKHSLSMSEAMRVCPVDRGAERERLSPVLKQTLISQWISDCRSAWREARIRACMLPAIAEV